MEIHLLTDIVIILGLSVLIVLLFQRLKLPSILGFLITGVLVGPYGLNMVTAVHEVEILAEIGVIFLLFVIGIEFSLKGLASIRSTVVIGGSLQVIGTIVLIFFFSRMVGVALMPAIFLGFLISLSSTAIVLKMLQEQGEISAPHGRLSVAILIYQDIIVVLMMLLTPIMAGQQEDPGMALLILLLKVAGIVIAVILLARFVVPVLLKWVVGTKSTELFILTTVVLCFATAWMTSEAGLSLALGAFFAGLIISESEYSHQANANILPFREIFISFFFVSIGMLLDLSFFIQNILVIIVLAIAVILIKLLVVIFAASVLRYSPRTILFTAFALFQVGEFAFVLSRTGLGYDLISEVNYQYFLAISIITMGLTPFVINQSPRLAGAILGMPLPAPVRERLANIQKLRSKKEQVGEEKNLRDHLIIVGYGINGQNVARAARKAGIPYVVVELDPEMIQIAKEKNVPVVFGDATNDTILRHVNVHLARVLVIAISAPEATRKIVRIVRSFSETIYIIVRTRYVREVESIISQGADEVIPEEFETSIEIFTRVLKKYLVTNNEINHFVNDIRSRNYNMLRSAGSDSSPEEDFHLHLSDLKIATLPVRQGKNRIVGKTIGESGLRKNFGVTVVAIKRGDDHKMDIDPDTMIKTDDILYVFGRPEDIRSVNEYCQFGQD